MASCVYSQAQTFADAARYAEYMPLGTARTVGAGSSFGAMGGDFSVVGINPAGIGYYYKSELTVSPGVGLTSADAVLNAGDAGTDSQNKNGFGLDNLGYVSANFDPNRNWFTSNYAVGLSRSKSFGREYQFGGSSVGSIAERWQANADGVAPDQLDRFETGPAFDAGVLIPVGDDLYDIDIFNDDVITKSQDVSQSGYINELNVAWAGNYKNKFSIGVSAAIPFLSFKEEKRYNESLNIPGEFENSLLYSEDLSTTGAGINLKAGMIYNLNPIRIGAAIHSPTWFTMEEEFSTSVDYTYRYLTGTVDTGSGRGESGDGGFTYDLTTPWKAVGSIGSLLNFGVVKGFVNADVEYVDYTNTSFDLTADSDNFGDTQYEAELNTEIDNRLNSGINIRLGTELAISHFRVRAGYAILKNPYTDQEDNTVISAGLGYRNDGYFIDLGYRLENRSEQYSPYAVADINREPTTSLDTNRGRLVATFGFLF